MSDISIFREKLYQLISKFEKDKVHYLSKGYLEAQVRIDFINPLFKALGWDIENKAHKPPHDRDVIVELSPETTGRPDYNFRINGATKFFVEAKAPSAALDDINHILQAKTYAWSTKEVYFVILTDFEEFKLYDASLKPNPKFPNEGLIFDFKYTDYPANIEKLWELSKERIEQGSLEALLPKDTKSKRLRIPPDKSFLEDLTQWRAELAKDIHKRNPEFDAKLLNDVVQRLLDRIVFIRIAEDRKIRPDRELWEIAAQWKEEGKRKSIMTHLKDLFKEVNDDLNGDIFKPHACESADVDSNLLAEIIESLYFPKSRYRFDAIGVELLGSIYERYLGSTIRVTPQRVKVEEKPEVRKAGGVYYTPKYIVDYIVKNTVGKLVEGKPPRQIEKIKILDPACGSGSFLLGAYQYLIDYHLKYYREHPKEAQTLHLFPYWKISPEELSLPIHEKAKILRNNIFGVNIDPQAVEITMMSLYLKALEGERGLLPRKQHLLPSLGNNIKCGNSLVGYDMLDNAPQPPLNLRGGDNPLSPPYFKGEVRPPLKTMPTPPIPPLKIRGGRGSYDEGEITKQTRMTEKSAWNWFKENYPAIADHLQPFADKAQKRYDKGEYWWELRTCDYYAEFEKAKIIVPAIVKSASYAFDTDGFYSNDKTSIIATDDLYLLGILNSRVSDFVMHSISSTKQGGYFEYKPMYLQQLPIRTIDFNNSSEKAIHDKLVSLVDRMLELHKRKAALPPSSEREKIEREIAVTDEKIDEIVYGLYGVTEEERKVIEGDKK